MAEIIKPNEQLRVAEPIAVDLGETDIETAMQAYLEFIDLPEDIKSSLYHPGDGSRTGASGYARKEGRNGEDDKQLFQWSPNTPLAAEALPVFKRPEAMRHFLAAAEEIYRTVTVSARARYTQLETNYPGIVGIHFPDNGKLNHKLRFLAYEPTDSGCLARGHYDKGSGTIALAESHEGLRLGTGPHALAAYERDPAEPVFFHGLGWLKLTKLLGRNTDRIPAWHDVVKTEGKQVNTNVMRWALIYFLDPAYLDIAPSKIETHTPLDLSRLGEVALEDQVAA